MDFETVKLVVVNATGLAKDALHIYVGISVYILCLFVLRPLLKSQGIRSFIAIIIVTGVALLGEYLDNRHTLVASGMIGLSKEQIMASIHDLINTCLLSYILFALMNWTTIFQTILSPSRMLKKQR